MPIALERPAVAIDYTLNVRGTVRCNFPNYEIDYHVMQIRESRVAKKITYLPDAIHAGDHGSGSSSASTARRPRGRTGSSDRPLE